MQHVTKVQSTETQTGCLYRENGYTVEMCIDGTSKHRDRKSACKTKKRKGHTDILKTAIYLAMYYTEHRNTDRILT